MVEIVEVVGISHESWKDATVRGIKEAAARYGEVSGVEILNFTADVVDGKIVDYKVDLNVSVITSGDL